MKKWLTVLFVCFACLTAHDALARGGGGCFEQGTPVLTSRTVVLPLNRR